MKQIKQAAPTAKRNRAALLALLAAALYALSTPFSKLLLQRVSATMMAAFLYLGAGVGMLLVRLVGRQMGKERREERLSRRDLPYTVGMVVLDIAAPIFLMLGLSRTTAANASLLNNFEIVATSIIALLVFHEAISRRLWIAIGLVTLASAVLSVEGRGSFSFSAGSLLVLLAATCWGLENNCTRMLSHKDPLEVVVIKGLFSGLGSLGIALLRGEQIPQLRFAALALLLGFAAYGLSIFFYIYAQRSLGAAKTSAYYAVTPFLGTLLSLILFRQLPTAAFWAALAIMLLGAYFAATDQK